jgi:hypothetical protein
VNWCRKLAWAGYRGRAGSGFMMGSEAGNPAGRGSTMKKLALALALALAISPMTFAKKTDTSSKSAKKHHKSKGKKAKTASNTHMH